MRPPRITFGLLLAAIFSIPLALGAEEKQEGKSSKSKKTEWRSLFDGKKLGNWTPTKFGGEGEVAVKDKEIHLDFGSDMTGITWKDAKSLPRINYEIALEAKRVDGSDFFCGLTFPVNKSYCSLIVGGWGGGVCGLSSIDGMDASENNTTTYRGFKKGQWYKIRVKVTEKKIQAWIDEKQIVDQDIKGRKISTRVEVDLSKPLGIATWQTSAALRNIRLRSLKDGSKDKSDSQRK